VNCPENFENRVALVGAEIARIEGRELDAERLYERAITARFYTARRFKQIADLYLLIARYGHLR
jgi:hypothetical protein